ncbi:S9 family peptidase [bacterium]|nr:S9 family peptidase [bacterium]
MAKKLILPLLLVTLASISYAQEMLRTHDIVPEDYFTQTFLSDCEASPDGKLTAFVDYRWDEENDRRSRDLWIVDNKTQELQRLTFDPGNEVNPQWSPDSKSIYFVGHFKQAGAEEAPYDGSSQIWKINSDGSELQPITRIPDGISSFQLMDDGKTIYYTRDKEFMIDAWKELRSRYKNDLKFGHGIHDVSELWKLDLTLWRHEKLIDPEMYIHEFAVSPDEKKIAYITTEAPELIYVEGWSDLRIFDTATKKVRVVPDKLWQEDTPSPYGWLGGLTWSDDSRMFAFDVGFDGYPTLLISADIANGLDAVTTKSLPRPGDVTAAGGLQWVPGKHELAFLGEDHGRERVYSVDVTTNNFKTWTKGDVVVEGFDFVGSRGEMVVIQSELTYYHDLVLYDRKGKSNRLTRLNPHVDTWKLPQISIFKWVGAEGDTVEGILELPPDYDGKSKLPLLVSLHGGPTASEKYCFLLWIYGRACYASKGYAMLSPNYRGSTGYGDDFLTDLIGHENDRDVTDILTGVDALIEQGIVDEERMGVTGWSNGGYLTNCLIATNRFKAASSGAGVFDMTMQLLEEDTPGHVINYMEGMPWEQPEEYQSASPVYSFKPGIKTAVLIHVGENDPRVPVTHSLGMHRILHHYLGVDCELLIYPGAGHNLTRYTHRLAKVQWDHAWFDKYLMTK